MDVSFSAKQDLNTQKMPPVDLSKIEQKYLCPQCKSLMNRVHQAYDCGCRFCHDCLDKYIKSGGRECPSCNTKLISSSLIPDVYIQRKINELQIECVVSICNWKGTFSNYRIHFYEMHRDLQTKCEYCNLELKNRTEYEKHLDKEAGDCLKQPIDCIYKIIGCNKIDNIESENSMDAFKNFTSSEKLKHLTRSTLEAHMYLNTNYHLELVYKHINRLKEELVSKTNKSNQTNYSLYDKNRDSILYSFSNLLNNQKINSSFSNDIKSDELNETSIGDSLAATSIISDPNNTQVVTNALTASALNEKQMIDIESVQKIQELNLKINTLENSHKSLITDLSRLFKTSEKLKSENQNFQDQIKEYKNMCQELHRTLTLTQVSLLTLEERLINQEKLSYNGTLVWKITNVHERIQEAKSGRQTSFYSPPFYTDRNGFKMCARIYLNGDGNGRNTHLSLFFVILRGEYDSLLRWPFRQKVTFILIDQSMSESKENIYDAFRPDPNSSSFRRPISEMNIASGLPVFCALGKFMSAEHEYIKDNTMFIKIIVDTKDLPEI